MNKKFLALGITLAIVQSGSSSCMFEWIKDIFQTHNPSDISFSSYNPSNIDVGSYINPIDQENLELEKKFNQLWDRIEKCEDGETQNRLTEQDAKEFAMILAKITSEKNPEIIKILLENKSPIIELVVESIIYYVPAIAESFFTNKKLCKSIITKQKNTRKFLKLALEKKCLKLIATLIQQKAKVKPNDLITLLYEESCDGFAFSTEGKFFNTESPAKLHAKWSQINKNEMAELLSTIKLLVKNGADVNKKTYEGSPIELAKRLKDIKNGEEIIKLIKHLLKTDCAENAKILLQAVGYNRNNLKDLSKILIKNDGELITPGVAKLLNEKDEKKDAKIESIIEYNKRMRLQQTIVLFHKNAGFAPKKNLPPCTKIVKLSGKNVVRPDIKICLVDKTDHD